MSLGKNKKNFNKGRKGVKKKVGDRFSKKEWWKIKSPGMFKQRLFTYSPVNMTVGKKLSTDSMKGRVFEANVGDLNPGYQANTKVKLIVEKAEAGEDEKIAYTNFYGLECTRDYLCSLIRKWHTLIDVFVDCKTSDGFLMRFFIVAFTASQEKQKKGSSFAQRRQVKAIRSIITNIMTKTCKKSTLKELVGKVLGDELIQQMEEKCKIIYPLENLTIRKVKSIKRPKIDFNQLNSIQTESEIAGRKIEKNQEEEVKEEKEAKN